MASPTEVIEEYRIAFHQLQALDRQQQVETQRMERDFDLARTRYERARAAYQVLALGEEDIFCAPEAPEE